MKRKKSVQKKEKESASDGNILQEAHSSAMSAILEEPTFDFLLRAAMILLFIAIILALVNLIIKNLLRSKEMAARQNLSVLARYRNKVTAAFWADLMDIRVGGVLPIGEKVEDFLWAMFPRAMENLEDMRTKNPTAWRETMKYLAPLVLSLKVVAHFKGQEALGHVMGWVEGIVGGNKDDPAPDPSDVKDLNQGRTGG